MELFLLTKDRVIGEREHLPVCAPFSDIRGR